MKKMLANPSGRLCVMLIILAAPLATIDIVIVSLAVTFTGNTNNSSIDVVSLIGKDIALAIVVWLIWEYFVFRKLRKDASTSKPEGHDIDEKRGA